MKTNVDAGGQNGADVGRSTHLTPSNVTRAKLAEISNTSECNDAEPCYSAKSHARPRISALHLGGKSHRGVRSNARYVTITTEQDFASLESEWRELTCDASYASPFSTWDWIWEWWRHSAPRIRCSVPGYGLCVVCAYDAHEVLIGIAPFFSVPSRVSPYGGRRLRLLGDIDELQLMTEEPTVLLRQGREEEAVASLLTGLKTAKFPHWRSFVLPVISPHPLQGAWRYPRISRGSDGPQTVSLPNTWDAFRAGLTRSMRDNTAYYPKRLKKHAHQYEFRCVTDPCKIAEAVLLLADLHRQRAEGDRGPQHNNYLPGPLHVAFLTAVMTRLALAGEGFIAVLEIDGNPVAAQAFLENAGRLTVYYSGFNPAWYDYSPLTILMSEVIRDAIRRNVQILSFLPGAQPWKARWGACLEMERQRLTWLMPASLREAARAIFTGRRALFDSRS